MKNFDRQEVAALCVVVSCLGEDATRPNVDAVMGLLGEASHLDNSDHVQWLAAWQVATVRDGVWRLDRQGDSIANGVHPVPCHNWYLRLCDIALGDWRAGFARLGNLPSSEKVHDGLMLALQRMAS